MVAPAAARLSQQCVTLARQLPSAAWEEVGAQQRRDTLMCTRVVAATDACEAQKKKFY